MGAAAGGMPKAFLPALDKTFISRSIDILRAEGVDDIIIVTGFCAPLFEDLAKSYGGGVRTAHNAAFETKGTMTSLSAALGLVPGPFLVLDADIIFERRAVRALLREDAENAILLSGIGDLGDEYLAWSGPGGLGENRRLLHLSKRREDRGDPPDGEHMGIMMVGSALAGALRHWAGANQAQAASLPYEACLLPLIQTHEMAAVAMPDLIWTEVDTEQMLDRARRVILPKLAEADRL